MSDESTHARSPVAGPVMHLHQSTCANSFDAFDRCAAALSLGWQVVFVGVDPDLSAPANTAVLANNGRHGCAGVTWLVWIASPEPDPDVARAMIDDIARYS